jgi:hypothetical protein
MRFTQPLRFLGTSPWPDYAARPSVNRWQDWGYLTPCVFSAECKRSSTKGDDTEAQVAMNSHPILVIFITLYLDIRRTRDEPIPPWMWVYALIYTENGFEVYTHSISTEVPTEKGFEASSESVRAGFRFRSTRFISDYSKVFRQDVKTDHRLKALTLLYMIRSHTLFVVDQVETWAKSREQEGGGMMDRFIARAQYELRKIDWLRDRVERLNTGHEETRETAPN